MSEFDEHLEGVCVSFIVDQSVFVSMGLMSTWSCQYGVLFCQICPLSNFSALWDILFRSDTKISCPLTLWEVIKTLPPYTHTLMRTYCRFFCIGVGWIWQEWWATSPSHANIWLISLLKQTCSHYCYTPGLTFPHSKYNFCVTK